MTALAIRERPASGLRSLGIGIAAGTMLLWSGVASAAPAPDGFTALAKKVTPAVVNIASAHEVETGSTPEMPFQFPEGSPFEKFFRQFQDRMGPQGRGHEAPRMAMGLGSGFIIDPSGYVVTNNHVIDGATEVKVRLDDDTSYPATIVGTDPLTDLALLKIDAGKPLPSVDFGDSDKAEVGSWVMAVGNPFGLGGTVTAGIVSARGRNIDAGPYDDFLQIDAAINKGNSGGPLFNMDGGVVGVNSAIYSPNGGSVGIGFAIPSNLVKTVVAQLKDGGQVERGWLGVQIQPVTPEIADAVGMEQPAGAMVTAVTEDSPAAKAGLKQGDVIVGYAGHRVSGPRELARVVAMQKVGSKTAVTIWRGDGEREIPVVTGRLTASADQPGQGAPVEPTGAYRSDALNAELASLTPERRKAYNIDEETTGVLVLDVEQGSAFEVGIREGDVIEEINQVAVSSPHEVDAIVEKAKTEKRNSVLTLINRRGHNLFLGLKLDRA
ncbi:DegQ family serine endoprotease [Oceanibacterium hippocampi]|uniref:Probable periplasmic serine endoprotease DegP-like n=1 Tax=Oceanibacterium hippocampi TaxID=745714 RepID=A0A1Y5TF06_9PROT|nr:DegQ family serine endoprotease [Oceanibacterium hippocampi]SLN62600.1 putative periplasmic serine endoprotease DegP-like precursor [Oceanibacterium hippocampi]